MERLRRKEYQSLLRPKKGVNDKSTCNFLAQRNRRRALRQRGKGSIMTATIKPDRYRFQTDVRGGRERLEKDGNAED